MTRRVVAVFGASGTLPGEPDWESGVRCGRLLAEAGYAVATGGYGGLMEAVSRGAAASGVAVIGVTAPAVFPDRAGVNPYVTEVIEAHSLTERIHRMIDLSSAAIALPGSIGTLAELVVAWNSAFVTRFSGAPAKPLAVVGPLWDGIVADLSDSLDTDGSLVHRVGTVDEAVALIRASVPAT